VRYGFDDVGLGRIIAQTMTVNTASRAVMERVGLTYLRTFPTSTTAPVEGIEEGEVECEMTREQWERLRSNSQRWEITTLGIGRASFLSWRGSTGADYARSPDDRALGQGTGRRTRGWRDRRALERPWCGCGLPWVGLNKVEIREGISGTGSVDIRCARVSRAPVVLGDETLRRDDAVALFDPVAEELGGDALGVHGDVDPA
jgi:hypothetical protein